jgi:hypothetical protein
MLSLARLAKAGYLLAFSLTVFLLASTKPSQAQFGAPAFGVSAGYRGTPGWPTIAIPIISGSASASGVGTGGGIVGITGGSVGGSVSGSFSTQIIFVNLGSFLPNGGRLIGMPPPTFTPMLSNEFFAGFLWSPFTADSTGSPFSLLTSMSLMGGMGMGGMGMGMGGMGMGGGMMGMGGGMMGTMMGGGMSGFGMGGFGMGGMSLMGMGGFGGFAGKGFGGFNGRKAL